MKGLVILDCKMGFEVEGGLGEDLKSLGMKGVKNMEVMVEE